MTDRKSASEEPVQKTAILSLERFAEASAYERHYPKEALDTILARLKIRRADLDAAVLHWSGVLGRTLEARDPSFVLRFARAYSRTEQRIRSRRPSPGAVEPLEHPEPTSTHPEVARVPELQKLPRKQVSIAEPEKPMGELPSYMLAQQSGERALSAGSMPSESEGAMARPITASVNVAELQRARSALPFDSNGKKGLPQTPATSIAPPSQPSVRTGTTELPNPTLAPPEIPFRRYVEYRIEAEASGSPSAAASKLGLTEEQRLSADLYWMNRFAADPAAREAYDSIAAAIRKSREPKS